MIMTRRSFFQLCVASAAVIGLSDEDLFHLEQSLASPLSPSIVWLQGSTCAGCSISFLNGTMSDEPPRGGNTVISAANILFHPMLMAGIGQDAVSVLDKVVAQHNYILMVEGGIPTAFNGEACTVWTKKGHTVTMKQAVVDIAANASAVIAVGTCASYGGISAAPPNPSNVKRVSDVIGKPTINVPGCPPHPDWILWTLTHILLKTEFATDMHGRLINIYGRSVHSHCPNESKPEVSAYGQEGCTERLGCRGEVAFANCPTSKWNGKVNWCIGAGGTCLGCTEPDFPAQRQARRQEPDEGHDGESEDSDELD